MIEPTLEPNARSRAAAAGLAGAVQDLLAQTASHDGRTAGHCGRVVGLARRVARALGLQGDGLRQASLVALLHDVGKARVPRTVLEKAGPLTGEEWTAVSRHTVEGARMVAERPPTADLATAIRASHERWDGRGYPDGLRGVSIPLASRISFVCDAFDAMVSDRPYRRTLSVAEALDEIQREAGRQFCPVAARALVAVVSPPWRVLGRPRRRARIA
jgi:putative nucleotidyltransferase with HDIG domain